MERHTGQHPIRTAPRNPDITVRGDSRYTPAGFEQIIAKQMHHNVMYAPVYDSRKAS